MRFLKTAWLRHPTIYFVMLIMLGGHLLQSIFDFIFGAQSLTDLLIEFGVGFVIVIAVAFLMDICANVVHRLIRKVVNWYVPLSAEGGQGQRNETR